MGWTQSDIDALKAAIALGATSVKYADGSAVEYRSLSQMRETLRMMQDDVAKSSAIVPSRSFIAGF